MWVGRGGEGGGGGSWKPTKGWLWSSGDSREEGTADGEEPELSSVMRLVTGVVLLGGIGGEGLTGTRLAPPVACVRSANMAAVLLLLTGLGGGRGGCFTVWRAEVVARDATAEDWGLAPAEDTVRAGLATAEADGEEAEYVAVR